MFGFTKGASTFLEPPISAKVGLDFASVGSGMMISESWEKMDLGPF